MNLRKQDQCTLAVFFGVLFIPLVFLALTGTPHGTDKSFRFLVDINTAAPEELQMLPGIGEKLTQEIIHYRNTYGKFKRTQELDNVKGIGVKKLAAVEPFMMPLEGDEKSKR